MTVVACPAAIVTADVHVVWALLMDPSSYHRWWTLQTTNIRPSGRARPGQQLTARMPIAGIGRDILTIIEMVDDTQYQMEVRMLLPLGITLRAHIVCVPLERRTCRVQIGSDLRFPPGLRGRCIERLAAKRCLRHIDTALSQIKGLAECAGRVVSQSSFP